MSGWTRTQVRALARTRERHRLGERFDEFDEWGTRRSFGRWIPVGAVVDGVVWLCRLPDPEVGPPNLRIGSVGARR